MKMNKVIISGNLTKEPNDLKTTQGGNTQGLLTVAVSRHRKDDQGNWQADFINVTTWGKTAENCKNYLHKGSGVEIVGHIRTGRYQNPQGETIFTQSIEAEMVIFTSKGTQNENNPQDQPGSVDEQTGMARVDDDDLPF